MTNKVHERHKTSITTPSDAEIREWMLGNLCRCTGYYKIIESIRAAAQPSRA